MAGLDGRIEIEGCDTIPKLFWHQVKARDGRTAFREKKLGIWRATSWRDYGERARWTGMGLVKLGLKRGEVVSILADTVPEWLYADMGTMGAGGVSNGIYPTDSAKQVDYILNDSRSRFLFVENEEQLDKFIEVRERCPGIAKVFVFDMEGLADFNDPLVMPFDELLALGRAHDAAHPGLWEELVAGSKADELALLVYTSGTTGPAKGAMLSHRNVVFQMRNADAFIPLGTDDEQLAFLPLCHIAERTFTAFLPLRSGAIANFAESAETVPENIREVAPTTFFAVPRIWERFYSGIAIRMKEATWVGRKAYQWALGIGLKVAEAELAGERPSPLLRRAARHRRLPGAGQHQARHRHAPRALRRHRRGADRARPDQMVSRAGRRHARGLRPDRELRPGDRHARPHQARHRRHHRAAHRDEDLARRRDPAQGPAHLHGLPEPAAEDGGDAARRLAAHRRRRLHRQRGLPQDHRPHEGHHHHRGRQEHHALGDREPAQVLALHLRRRGDRRSRASSCRA